ncbi:MAG: hypothetical protein H6842_08770 [Rhodospirillaceae bacterium]|nr:hypothetical protein [Rhodospirillaceae bacterium]
MAAAAAAAIYAFIVLVDPYGALPFSLPLARVPADQNQRYSYPMVARDPRYDSLVIGTSTARLLRPDRLDARLGGQFANLAMNSARAYEQYLIADLFLRRQPAPRTVIVGVDHEWCLAGDAFTLFSDRPFPPWMYDDDPYNDLLHLFNARSLEIAVNQLGMALGLIAPRYGPDGYANFLPPDTEYDLARAQENIYGPRGPRPPTAAAPLEVDAATRQSWTFPALDFLGQLARRLPDETVLVAVLVPYHVARQPGADTLDGQQWRECRRRIAGIVASRPRGHVVDFMVPSPITTDDRNYWDALHYTTAIADSLVDRIADGVAGRESADGTYVLRTADAGDAVAPAGPAPPR